MSNTERDVDDFRAARELSGPAAAGPERMSAPDPGAAPPMPDGTALMREFLKHSPFARELGLEIREAENGRAVLAMPFREELTIYGPVVHGGALAAAADTAAMVAAFAGRNCAGLPLGTTAGFNISYLRAVTSSDIRAEARVIKRGESLDFIDVDILNEDGVVAARANVIYKTG